MARHTIQIPIIKSSNSPPDAPYYPTYQYCTYVLTRGTTVIDSHRLNPPSTSTKLYAILSGIERRLMAGFGSQYFKITRFGVGWDSGQVPVNKILVNAKLMVYSVNSHNRAIYYQYRNFAEGSEIGELIAGGAAIGATQGWTAIDIGVPKSSEVVFEVAFEHAFNQYTSGGSTYYEYFGGYWEMYSHRDPTYAPYIELTYDDYPPGTPTGLYPSGGTLNSRDVIRFSWAHNSPEKVPQKGFTLRYSLNSGASWTTISETTPLQHYDLAANTLPISGVVLWQVKTTDTNDEESEYSQATFAVEILPQQPPIPIVPSGQYVDRAKPIRFEWAFVGGTPGETQTKYDLQYSTNGGLDWVTVSDTTSAAYYELPANSLAQGPVVWRVRTQNNWDEVSPYSGTRTFTVIGVPGAPQITGVTSSGKPTVSWTAGQQSLVELLILKGGDPVYETGILPTQERSHTLDVFLNDGDYRAKIRVANDFSMWSEWVEADFTLETDKPAVPSISASLGRFSVTLVSAQVAGIDLLVYRDGKKIGRAENGMYSDYTCRNGTIHDYHIRAVDENNNFADSSSLGGKVKFEGNTLAPYSSPKDYVHAVYGYSNPIAKTLSSGQVGALINIDGRRLPVVDFSDNEISEREYSLFFREQSEYKKVVEMIHRKEALLLRDSDGTNIIGAVFNVMAQPNLFGYQVSFSISEIEVQDD